MWPIPSHRKVTSWNKVLDQGWLLLVKCVLHGDFRRGQIVMTNVCLITYAIYATYATMLSA